LKLLRSHGQSRKYYHESFGLNYRMTEIGGALGLVQLKKLPAFTEKRRRNAQYLNQQLAEVDGVTLPFVAEGVDHSFHQYSILLDLDSFRCSRDEFIAALEAEGVEAAVHYPRALHQQPAFAADGIRLPNCEWLTERIISLPVHPLLSEAELERVTRGVCDVAARMHR
jgi:perosamine synthetase